MTTLLEFLSSEHRHCDDGFASVEEAAQTGDLATCHRLFAAFQTDMEQHFQKEEEALFPAFEHASGNSMGPTRVMRLEHQQMRETLAEMNATLAVNNPEDFLGQAETLLILMQQHNIKEEQILYPMCDRVLAPIAGDLIAEMQAIAAS